MRGLLAGDGGAAFDVPVKPRSPSSFPVRRVICVSAEPRTKRAEEDVTGGVDHDACVPLPHHQVAGLGTTDALKLTRAGIKVRGGRIAVGKTSACVDGVYQM